MHTIPPKTKQNTTKTNTKCNKYNKHTNHNNKKRNTQRIRIIYSIIHAQKHNKHRISKNMYSKTSKYTQINIPPLYTKYTSNTQTKTATTRIPNNVIQIHNILHKYKIYNAKITQTYKHSHNTQMK